MKLEFPTRFLANAFYEMINDKTVKNLEVYKSPRRGHGYHIGAQAHDAKRGWITVALYYDQQTGMSWGSL
jgi:hypothetical protein